MRKLINAKSNALMVVDPGNRQSFACSIKHLLEIGLLQDF